MRRLSKKETLLLKVFVAAAAAGALAVFLAFTLPEAGRLQSRIAALEQGIENAKTLEVNEKELGAYYEKLESQIEKEKQSYYAAEEQDLTRLGMRMLALVKRNGLTYSRLTKVDSKDGNYLEIGVSGNVVGLLRFLQEIYGEAKYLNVDYLTMSNDNGRVKATVRMNYGMAPQISH
jgi:hypothetical protein